MSARLIERALGLCALALLLAACAAAGDSLVTPEQWQLEARPLAQGVLATWNVPRRAGREVLIIPVESGEVRRDLEWRFGAESVGASLLELPPGQWRLQLKVFDAKQSVGPARTSEPFEVTLSDALLRPVTVVDAGVEAPIDVPVLVWVPAWSSDAALREALEFVAMQGARVAFGEAWRVGDAAQLDELLAARRTLLRDGGLPLGLDARVLLTCDLRPAVAAQDQATLALRLYDLACLDHGLFRPRSGRTLLAEAFVDLPGLEVSAGLFTTPKLMAGLRGGLGELLGDPTVLRVLPALASDEVWSTQGQRRLLAALTGVGQLPPGSASDYARIERELLFPRATAPDETPDETPGDADDADDAAGADDVEPSDVDDDAASSADAEAPGA